VVDYKLATCQLHVKYVKIVSYRIVSYRLFYGEVMVTAICRSRTNDTTTIGSWLKLLQQYSIQYFLQQQWSRALA